MLDFVIVGAQKGGSTALAAAVGQHPQVWMAAGETPMFRDPVWSADRAADFLGEVARHDDVVARGIKCPDYLGRPEVPRRLREAGVDRIVVCLRDPVARAISTYYWHVRWGLLPIEDPSDGLARVLAGAYNAIDPTAPDIVDWGFYARHLRRYRDVFPADRVHVLLSSDLRVRAADTYRNLFAFLGVDDAFEPRPDRRAANEGVYVRQRLKFLSVRNRYILTWDDERTYADIPPARGVFPVLISRGFAGVDRYVLRRIFGNNMPPIRESVREQLRELYRDDVQDLERLLDRPLTEWR